jgi:hypothetical protein
MAMESRGLSFCSADAESDVCDVRSSSHSGTCTNGYFCGACDTSRYFYCARHTSTGYTGVCACDGDSCS